MRICVVTGSRAEYGILYWILRDLRDSPDVELQLVVTGAHLSPEHGMTVSTIEADGIPIAARVEMLLSTDSACGITKSLGLGAIGFADTFRDLAPELVLLLGDRFEVFAAAQAAMFANIPIAHIAGGDTTEGAFDEAIRHSITKMSHVHFVTNEQSARRVRQMGEDPRRVYVVGSPGIDSIRRLPLLSREALQQQLGVSLGTGVNLLITFHPVTLDPSSSLAQFGALLEALETLPPTSGFIFTAPNADTMGRRLNEELRKWAAGRANAHVFTSLGQLRYLSLMAQVDAVVGNSSSGIYEAPALAKPTVNIGDRQKGRLAARSVIHCPPERDRIIAALHEAWALDCTNVDNPYGDGHSSERIVRTLVGLKDPRSLLQKHFHLLDAT